MTATAGGAYAVNAAKTTLAISYDATDGSYLVSAAGNSETFAGSSHDTTLSTSQFDVYKVTSGNTTDTLTLTRPGTAGALTYQYVGAGFWQRTNVSGSTGSGLLAAFTYGFPSAIGGIPRGGSVAYQLTGLGASAYTSGTLRSLNGSGTVAFYFGTGEIRMTATLTEVDPVTKGVWTTFQMTGQGTLSSSQNGFSGTTKVVAAPFTLTGDFAGRFYGPNAEEVGLTYDLNGQATFEGALIGRQDTTVLRSGTFDLDHRKLPGDQSTSMGYTVHPSGLIDPAYSYSALEFSILGTDSYRLASGSGLGVTFMPGDKEASDSSFTTFRTTTPSSTGSQPTTQDLTLFNVGANNPTLALTYSSFGFWRSTTPQASGDMLVSDRPFVYGQETSADLMPMTGSATYSGTLGGRGTGPISTTDLYNLTGTVRFEANFATGALTSTLNGDLHNTVTQVTATMPTLNLNGTIAGNGAGLTGSNAAGWSGAMAASFFGPTAQELGGTFTLSAPTANGTASLTGAAVAKRQ